MDGLEIIILSQAKTNVRWYHLYVESKKKQYKWTYFPYKTETDSQSQKTNLKLPKGNGRRDSLGIWDYQMYTII